MDELHTDADESVLTQTTGRRRTVHTIGAAAIALLASFGLTMDASAGKRLKTRREISESSDPLPVAVDSTVSAFADCGGEGKALSCSYQTSSSGAELLNAFVSTVGPNNERTGCAATLRRTAGSGSTVGATIQAMAVCRV
jgi:hypothetical protein